MFPINQLVPMGSVLALPNKVVTRLRSTGSGVSESNKFTTILRGVNCSYTESLFAAEIKNELCSIDRKFAEIDYNYRQLLPYVVFVCTTTRRVLNYKRGKAGSESRLHDLRSVGFGGHIDSQLDYYSEAHYRYQFDKLIFDNIKREVQEELGWDTIEPSIKQFEGLLISNNPDPKEVGHYHLGMLFIIQVDSRFAIQPEVGNVELPEWVSIGELDQLNLEPWSHAVKPVLNKYL